MFSGNSTNAPPYKTWTHSPDPPTQLRFLQTKTTSDNAVEAWWFNITDRQKVAGFIDRVRDALAPLSGGSSVGEAVLGQHTVLAAHAVKDEAAIIAAELRAVCGHMGPTMLRPRAFSKTRLRLCYMLGMLDTQVQRQLEEIENKAVAKKEVRRWKMVHQSFSVIFVCVS